jgi:hypothetical protein
LTLFTGAEAIVRKKGGQGARTLSPEPAGAGRAGVDTQAGRLQVEARDAAMRGRLRPETGRAGAADLRAWRPTDDAETPRPPKSTAAQLSRRERHVPSPPLDPGGFRGRTAPPVRIRSLDPVPVPGPPRRAGGTLMPALFTGLVTVAAMAAALAVAAAYLSGGPPAGDRSVPVVAPVPSAQLPDPLAAAAPPAAAPTTVAREPAPADPALLAAGPTPTVEAAPARSPARPAPVRRASADMADLADRVGELMAAGDAAGARALLASAAEAGNATAALMLAGTYDPNALRTLGIPAVRPDVRKARAWYEKAAQLGSPEASRRLAALAAQR